LRQVFRNNLAAFRTLLRCPSRVHFHECDPGAFSLGSQRQQEIAPGNIADRAGQPIVPEHVLDAQALDRDEPVATDQLQGDLVVMLATKVLHASVSLRDRLASLAAVLAPLLLPGEAALLPAKFGQRTRHEPHG
jgi:hypothetical protein